MFDKAKTATAMARKRITPPLADNDLPLVLNKKRRPAAAAAAAAVTTAAATAAPMSPPPHRNRF